MRSRIGRGEFAGNGGPKRYHRATDYGFTRRRVIRHLIVAIASLVALAGCATTTTSDTLKVKVEVLDHLRRYERAYVLQPGDQIEVFIYRHPDLSRHTTIRPDGMISLPLAGELHAAGRAPRELQDDVTKHLEDRIKNPEVTVIVENTPEPSVFVVGEVGAPRAVPLRQARTAAEALAQAGSANHNAAVASVSVIRLNAEGYLEAITADTSGLNQPGAYMALQNIPLVANDLVVVPESYRAQSLRALSDFNLLLTPYFQYRVIHDVIN